MKRVYVFHSFHFMLQNKRSMEKMHHPSLPEFLGAIALLLLFAYVTFLCLEYFYHRVSPFDPGALIGIGVLGCIGVIGCTLGHMNVFTFFALCLLGGCLGSGMYRFHEDPSDHQNRYRVVGGGNGQRAIGW